MQKFEVVKFGPYRFIGKVAYARTGKSDAVYKASRQSNLQKEEKYAQISPR